MLYAQSYQVTSIWVNTRPHLDVYTLVIVLFGGQLGWLC